MNWKTFFCLIGLWGTSLVWAEARAGGSVGVHLLGGFSSTNHKQNGLGVVESQMGLTFGLGIDFIVMPQLAIEVDFLNAQKNFELTPGGSSAKESYYLTFMQVPVLVKLLASKNFHLKAGPYLSGLLMSGYREGSGASSPVKDQFRNDYGVTLGAWLGMQTKKNLMIGLDMRYDIGLADLRNDNLPETNLYSRTLVTLLTFTFLFK